MKKFLLLVLNMAAALSLFTFSTSAAAQIGSLSSDLVFTPVTPCRIMDTRNPGAKSGILVAGSTRGFWAWSAIFSAQGGSATGCGTLASADEAVIVVNFTVVAQDAAGYITVFPADAAQPLAATVNYGAGAVVGNNATLKVAQVALGDGFKIYSTSNVHVVADIVGYYAKPVSTGSLLTILVTGTTVNVPANTYASLGTIYCPAGYIAMSVGFGTGGSDVLMADGFASGAQGLVYVRNVSALTLGVTPTLTCIKLAGR